MRPIWASLGRCPMLTLVANSIPYSRGRLQRRESRAAGPRQRRPRPPLAEPHQVDRRRRQEVLQMRLRLTDIAAPPQTAPPDRLFMSPLDARSRRVSRSELLASLLAADRLHLLVLLTGQQPDDPRLLLRPRALRPGGTWCAVLPREPRLEDHAVL